jgi:hypothetical protein
VDNIILLKKIKDLEFILKRTKIKDWKSVQDIVRTGMGHKIFQVGDQFLAEFNGTPSVWDVIGIDHDKPTDSRFTHSLTIQSHDCLLSAQFSAPQALYYAETSLPVGQHRFTLSGVQSRASTKKPPKLQGSGYR